MMARECLRNAALVAVLIAVPLVAHARMAAAQAPEHLMQEPAQNLFVREAAK